MKRILSILLIFSLLACTVGAVEGQETRVDVILSNTLEVRYGGDTFDMYDANGFNVYPILRSGTTYLPVRALSERFNKTIEWDATNYAVKIYDTPPTIESTQPQPGRELNYPITVSATESRKLAVYYNDRLVTFEDVNGSRVYPLLYNGTTYLPVRALSNLFDTSIVWDSDRYAVYIGKDVKDSSSVESLGFDSAWTAENISFFGATWPTALVVRKDKPLILDVPANATKCRIRGISDNGTARVGVVRPDGDEVVLQQYCMCVDEYDLEINLSGATQVIVSLTSKEGCSYVVEVVWDENIQMPGVRNNPEEGAGTASAR